MTQLSADHEYYLRKRTDHDRDQRFNVKRTIPKIGAEGPQELLEEFESFEETFARTNPTSAREWAITLDEALVGKAKN